MKITTRILGGAGTLAILALLSASAAHAQNLSAPSVPAAASAAMTAGPEAALPPDFVLGPYDVLTVLFWRDKDMSGEVAVRPDGRISLPLLNDIQAAGLTPEQLRDVITKAAAKYVDDPTVTIVVKEINSRRVFITGQVTKRGQYSLTGPTTVLQLIAMAGGVLEYADAKHIVVMRTVNGQSQSLPFNYKDVVRRKNLKQNIELKSGDTVVVP
jgi:polysaccharide export outer membrane protein